MESVPSPQRGAQLVSTPHVNPARTPSSPGFYDFGPFRIDLRRRRLLRDGELIPLKPKAFDTLLVLVERQGRVVEKDELIALLWPDTVVEEANLTQNVFMIRKALGEPSGEQGFISTVARRGYRFVGDVRYVGHDAVPGADGPVPAIAADEPGAALPRSPALGRRVLVAAAAALLLGAGIASYLAFARWPIAPTPIRSIAVLPLRNLSADSGQDYFVEGMTDAVITDLARISALRVVSYQSVVKYRSSDKPLPEIARELGADAVVQGSVGRSEGRLRLSVQLVDARTDGHLWAGSFDRNLGDVLALQGELARTVARVISVALTTTEQAALTERRPVNPDAYDMYLRARHFWTLRATEESLRRSLEYYQQAITLDPAFAPAYAGLALALAPAAYQGFMRPSDVRPQVQAAAEKAVALDPGLVDAQVAFAALTVVFDWDWAGGERAWNRILERYPDHPVARLWHGLLLENLGRHDEALRERERALALDPLSLQYSVTVGDTYALQQRYDEGLKHYGRALDLNPAFVSALRGRGWAYLKTGRAAEGIAGIEEAVRLSDGHPLHAAWLVHAYALTGRTQDARRVLRVIEERAAARYVSPVHLAQMYAALGRRDAAFAQLDAAYRERAPSLSKVKVDPLLEPLRGDARFAALLERMNLPL